MDENLTVCTLCQLEAGESGRITAIYTKGDMRRRFMDMGLIADTKVTCILKSSKGDISAYLIRGAVIAIRCEDVREIFVVKIKE
ncbi:MAG: ferrous iron transport protein A [Ruminococcaceae bacterium]|nr:ferrous iron transport protein A [Oscillospiraceae bacterium]